MEESIALHIVSPEKTLASVRVSQVSLPGIVSPFTVLKDHAPMVTALARGEVRYVSEGREERIPIREGFVEVLHNEVNVCVEVE